jgi:hypothetical protein
MTPPPVWSREELEEERLASIAVFREERLQEPLDEYLREFDEYRSIVEDLLAKTADLNRLDETALKVMTDGRLLEAFRYLPGPVISADDLKTLADAVLSPARLRQDPDMVRRILEVVHVALDPRRFPWIQEHREPTEAERGAAILASAALMANSRALMKRRSQGKENQERAVERQLLDSGMTRVETRAVQNLHHAPAPGRFCRESLLGARKADFVVTLWDGRLMPVECKVSNSAVNSVKRLNNDAAAKAEAWIQDFGRRQAVPVAIPRRRLQPPESPERPGAGADPLLGPPARGLGGLDLSHSKRLTPTACALRTRPCRAGRPRCRRATGPPCRSRSPGSCRRPRPGRACGPGSGCRR